MTDEMNQPEASVPPPPPGHGTAAEDAPDGLAPAALKSAYNAFKKKWKLTRLDYDSRIGRGPLSGGGRSSIVGIEPPKEFPRAVWEALVQQGRLKQAGSGLYALP